MNNRPTICIIEGLDGLGKTTLINSLCQLEHRFKLVPTERRPQGHSLGEYDPNAFTNWLALLPADSSIYLLDRHEQSNIAYSAICRQECSPRNAMHQIRKLAELAELIEVYLIADLGLFIGDAGYEDEHIKLTLGQRLSINRAYSTIANWSKQSHDSLVLQYGYRPIALRVADDIFKHLHYKQLA